jgi:regulation of enolase protein 1 (concanavalin A-like superfamily)
MRGLFLIAFICAPLVYAAHTNSGPVVINGQNGTVLENLHITSTSGPCVSITNSTGIKIHNSEIGPCGGNGIVISGGSGIQILDSYVHPEYTQAICCDSGDGILATGTTNVLIQGNVIAYGEDNILLVGASGGSVIGNFLLNPRNYGGNRGVNVQVYDGSQNVTIQNNYALSSLDTSRYAYPGNQSDSINFVGGSRHVSGIIARGNYVQGGFWANGCGIIADSGADSIQFLSNTLVDTGECGIGVADGINHIIDSNKIINSTPVAGGGNTAIYVWKVYATDPPCGPVQVTNNIASELKPDMVTESGFWNGGGCEPVSMSNNIFDSAARTLLYPPSTKLPPPMIPPQPSSCAAVSPFTNQTAASCSGTSATPPSVSLTQPTANSTISGTATVGASPSSGVTSVSFVMDGSTTLGQVSASPWTMSLDSTKVANGLHSLVAVAQAAGLQGQSAPVSFTIQNTVSAPTSPSSGLNTNLWKFVAPAGGSYSTTGSQLVLVVPAGSSHDPIDGGQNQSVRVMQQTGNTNFAVDVKFDVIPKMQYEFEGLVVEQDATHFVWFQFGSDNYGVVCNTGVTMGGTVTTPLGGNYITVPTGATSLIMRVTRTGDTFTQSWSSDGATWHSMGSFVQSMTLSAIGPFAGNYSPAPSTAPAFSATVDYFLNNNPPAAAQPVTDQFGQSSGLNKNLWSFVGPGGATYTSNSNELSLVVPAGSNHDPVDGSTDQSARIVQKVGNVDFSVQAKFDVVPTKQYQFEGIVVEQDATHYLWFQLGSDASGIVCNVGSLMGGVLNVPLGGSYITLPSGTTSIRLRVARSGNTFTEAWSTDNTTWHNVGSFSQAMTVADMGPFAGNYGANPAAAPAFTVPIDLFVNENPPPSGQPVSDQFNQ